MNNDNQVILQLFGTLGFVNRAKGLPLKGRYIQIAITLLKVSRGKFGKRHWIP